VVSASLRKSITDLSRRRTRTLFTVATLGIAVASFALLAVPTLIDRTMQDEVRAARLVHLTVEFRPLELTDGQLAALAALPNVAALEAGNEADARVLVGERRAPAEIYGVRDFARQTVNVVRIDSGAAPRPGEVLVDVQDANVGVYGGGVGDTVRIVGVDRPLRISGKAFDLLGGDRVQSDKVIVLYTTTDTVSALSGDHGYGGLAFRLRDTRPAAAAATVAAVRRYLQTVPGFTGLSQLPQVRAPDDWPGKEDTENFAKLMSVITLVALLSALVLIANTMTTLVAEQTGEIGIMRALGARRRQVAVVYLKTALLLATLGTAAGIGLGVLLSSLLARYFASTFWAVDVGFGVDLKVVILSALVGLLAPPLAALPAIRRGVRVDLREALESTGSAVGSQDAGDRLLRRARFLPRTAQIGLRGVGRRKRGSLATAVIVALAVGNMLAFMGLAAAATQTTRAAWDEHAEQLRIWTNGRELFDERAARAIRATPGVAQAQAAQVTDVELAGEDAVIWGVVRDPLIRLKVTDGRWFTAAEEQGREHVAVVESALARVTGVRVGDRVRVSTPAGSTPFRIIGLSKNRQEDGTVLFVPLTTARSVLGETHGATTYWIRTTSPGHALVDRTMTRLEDRLARLGYEVGGEITYVKQRDEIAANRSLTTTIALIGLLIVAISMAGLANAVTTNVLERRREIGILRCLGARARDIRRIFTTEGLVLVLAGWLLGIPVGYAILRGLIWLVERIVNVDLPVVFPLANIPLTLAGTVALALLIMLLPVRSAARLRPGDALRYA
jgi:putative ABC transport system permease protein